MATITFTIDDTKAPLLKEVFGHPGWTNAELSRQVKTFLLETLKLRVQEYQERQVVEVARAGIVIPDVIS